MGRKLLLGLLLLAPLGLYPFLRDSGAQNDPYKYQIVPPPPLTPDDLARHDCVQYRRAAGAVFEWPFERDGKSREISMNGRVMVNDTNLAVRAAVDGLGIAYTLESLVEPFLRSGQLVRVLENWSPSFEGLFLYYPGHRQVPVVLRALMDMLRTARGSAPAKVSLEIPFAAD